MMDDVHPDDQLFLYFEHDFRFYERDDLPPAEWAQLLEGVSFASSTDDPAATAASSSSNVPPGGAVRPPAGDTADAPTAAAERPRKRDRRAPHGAVSGPPSIAGMQRPQGETVIEGIAEISPELVDLVCICNEAARHNVGNFVWLGWNADFAEKKDQKVKRPDSIMYGSQCIAFTKSGARDFLELMGQYGPAHIDLWFLCRLVGNELLQRRIGASYCIPPIGGYSDKHVSMNLKGERRLSCWRKFWAQEGVRERPHATALHGGPYRPRYLAGWTSKGPARWIVDIPLACDLSRYIWLTEAGPLSPLRIDGDGVLYTMLRHRGWVLTQTGQWTGPFDRRDGTFGWWPDREKTVSDGNIQPWDAWWNLPELNEWRSLQERPAELSPMSTENCVLSRMLAALVCEPLEPREEPSTDRSRRARFRRVKHYTQRCFPDALDLREVLERGKKRKTHRAPDVNAAFRRFPMPRFICFRVLYTRRFFWMCEHFSSKLFFFRMHFTFKIYIGVVTLPKHTAERLVTSI